MICKKCGAQVNNDELFCYRCGAKVPGPVQDKHPVQRSKKKWPFILGADITGIDEKTLNTNNKKIVSVSKKGMVVGKSVGSTDVTAVADGKTVITAKVKLSGTKQEMRAVYTIEDEQIAVISANGKIVGLTPGTTTLTATLAGKNYTTQISIE